MVGLVAGNNPAQPISTSVDVECKVNARLAAGGGGSCAHACSVCETFGDGCDHIVHAVVFVLFLFYIERRKGEGRNGKKNKVSGSLQETEAPKKPMHRPVHTAIVWGGNRR